MPVPMVTTQSSSWVPVEAPSSNSSSPPTETIQFQVATYSWRSWKATTLTGTEEVNVETLFCGRYNMLKDHRRKVMPFKQMGH